MSSTFLRILGLAVSFQAGALRVEAAVSPVVPPNSVVNNASFASGTTPLAPGTIAAIFGSNLDDGSKNPFSSFGANGELLTTLGGASVTFNGIPAPIFSAFPGQLNVQIPLELAGQTSAEVIVTVAGQSSPAQTLPIGSDSPGIFAINQTGGGQGDIQFANTTTYVAPPGSISGARANAGKPGEFITIYCTGLGAVENPPETGKPAPGNPPSMLKTAPKVTIGGISATVSFAGLAPGFVGLYQVNVQIPAQVPSGIAVQVKMTVGGKTSNTVNIAIIGNLPSGARIAAGDLHTCAVTAGGGVLCWGGNSHGQLGNGTAAPSSVPVPVTGLSTGVVAVTAGADFTCALTDVGTVLCWGYNAQGEVGNGKTSDAHTPVQVMNSAGTAPLSGLVAIGSGHYQTCGVTSAGTLICWGADDENDEGPEKPAPGGRPVQVTGIPSNIAAVSGGNGYTLALTSGGELLGWGMDSSLGIGALTGGPNYGTPVQVQLGSVYTVYAGYEDACAVLTDATLWCWGANSTGEVGNNNNRPVGTPVQVLSGIVAASGGDDDTCALTGNGGVMCWGSSSNGQNGTGPMGSTDTFTPQQVVGLEVGVVEIASGYRHNCAVTVGGGVLCWGFNIIGQLGNGNTKDQNIPVPVVGLGGNGLLGIF